MRRTLVLALALVAFACAKEPAPEQSADFIFYGGTITTPADAARVEALAVRGGVIVDMGAFKDMHDRHASAMTRMIDLHGAIAFPATMDAEADGDVMAARAAIDAAASAGASIAVGQPADFVVLSHDPAVADEKDQLHVVKIVRAGETLFRAHD